VVSNGIMFIINFLKIGKLVQKKTGGQTQYADIIILSFKKGK
jgi:hypothetical protein